MILFLIWITPEKMLQEEHPLDVWVSFLLACDSYFESLDDDYTIATTEAPSLADLRGIRQVFQTPRRLSMSKLLSSSVDASPGGLGQLHGIGRLVDLADDESGQTIQLAHVFC